MPKLGVSGRIRCRPSDGRDSSQAEVHRMRDAVPIPQRGTIGLGLCRVVLQSLLVAQLLSLAQILSLERQRRRVTDLYCENSGQDVRGHFRFGFGPGCERAKLILRN
jgi:hypothetical protein